MSEKVKVNLHKEKIMRKLAIFLTVLAIMLGMYVEMSSANVVLIIEKR